MPSTTIRRGLGRALPFLALALGVGLLAAAGTVRAEDAPSRPLVVKIHADWCGTCQRLAPTWERIERELGDRADVVVLDVTDRTTLASARARAEALGITALLDEYKGSTGTIAVLDGTTHEPVAVFKGELAFEPYAQAVAKARGTGAGS